jgi:hypothetical protein
MAWGMHMYAVCCVVCVVVLDLKCVQTNSPNYLLLSATLSSPSSPSPPSSLPGHSAGDAGPHSWLGTSDL